MTPENIDLGAGGGVTPCLVDTKGTCSGTFACEENGYDVGRFVTVVGAAVAAAFVVVADVEARRNDEHSVSVSERNSVESGRCGRPVTMTIQYDD